MLNVAKRRPQSPGSRGRDGLGAWLGVRAVGVAASASQARAREEGVATAASAHVRVDEGPLVLQLPAVLEGHDVQHCVHHGGQPHPRVLQGVLVRNAAQNNARLRVHSHFLKEKSRPMRLGLRKVGL